MRISGLASNPPEARTTAPASIVSLPAGVRTTTPVTAPRSSVTSRVAFDSKRTSMPCFAADWYSMSINPGAAADRLEHQTAPEAELSADLVGLPAEHRDPADAAIAHPLHGRQRLAHELHRHVRIGAVLGDPHEVVVELLFRVRVDLHRGLLLVGEVADQVAQLVEALEGEPEAAGREEAVAAAPGFGRLLEHEDARAVLARRERRAHRRIAAADDDDVVGHVVTLPIRPDAPAPLTVFGRAAGVKSRESPPPGRGVQKSIRLDSFPRGGRDESAVHREMAR